MTHAPTRLAEEVALLRTVAVRLYLATEYKEQKRLRQRLGDSKAWVSICAMPLIEEMLSDSALGDPLMLALQALVPLQGPLEIAEAAQAILRAVETRYFK